ncbi:ElyC/SanA/YdcF family protein [Demequina capsici]|uniref:ElyC/SanA/YdcF family protein n=1 Tax=Demequina capsici TaxID=3075620 RepID=A0AA96JGK5_9MICO|nr:ElyC/SanA/YdcF family protein [Demequina sp. PMTSA13]WNM28049.1 ElyC/SanA/YdcF family protein [Demequina sp. PMTSA13]
MTRLPPRYRLVVAAVVLVPALAVAPWMYVNLATAPSIARAGAPVTHADAALVLGARVYEDGTPSRFLRERIEVGVALYEAGDVDMLIMSGDGDDSSGFGEPTVMRQIAEQMGVPSDAIVEDPFGLDTYSSCERARDVYGASSVVVATQEFHEPRAVWLCQRQGLDVQGRYPGIRLTRSTVLGNLRELAAIPKAILDMETGRVGAAY